MPLPQSIKAAQSVDGTSSFICEGITYYVAVETLSAVRAEEFLKLAPHLSVSMELLDVHSLLTNIYQDLSNVTRLGDVVDSINKIGNILLKTKEKSAGQISLDQIDVVYDLCALFIVRPGEDMTTIDRAALKEKVDAWKRNMDFLSFFLLARQLSTLFKTPSNAG